jgi:hypothetical protein
VASVACVFGVGPKRRKRNVVATGSRSHAYYTTSSTYVWFGYFDLIPWPARYTLRPLLLTCGGALAYIFRHTSPSFSLGSRVCPAVSAAGLFMCNGVYHPAITCGRDLYRPSTDYFISFHPRSLERLLSFAAPSKVPAVGGRAGARRKLLPLRLAAGPAMSLALDYVLQIGAVCLHDVGVPLGPARCSFTSAPSSADPGAPEGLHCRPSAIMGHLRGVENPRV